MRDPADFAPPSAETLERFSAIIGRRHMLTDARAMAPFLREWRDKYVGHAAAVLRPGSEEEVAALLAVANEANIAAVRPFRSQASASLRSRCRVSSSTRCLE